MSTNGHSNGTNGRRIGNGLNLDACNDHSMIQKRLKDPRWKMPDDVKARIQAVCMEIVEDDEARGRLRLHAAQTLMAMERQNQTDEIEGAKIKAGVGQPATIIVNQYVDEDGGTVTDYIEYEDTD